MYRLELSYIARRGGSRALRSGAAGQQREHSAVAASAYRTGSMLVDHATGTVHDYRRKRGVVHSEIVLPDVGAHWARDSELLWNAVEYFERRKDARLALEFIVCLPLGMNAAQNLALTRTLARAVAARHALAVEFAIHQDHPRSWQGERKAEPGCHAHVLMTTRRLQATGFSKRKAHEFFDRESGPRTVRYWRSAWQQIGNSQLLVAGMQERWDCRSLRVQAAEAESRGDVATAMVLDRWPGVHLGRAMTALERRGLPTQRGNLNRWIEASNAMRRRHRERLTMDSDVAVVEARLTALRESVALARAAANEDAIAAHADPRWWPFLQAFIRQAELQRLHATTVSTALKLLAPEFSNIADDYQRSGLDVTAVADDYARNLCRESVVQKPHEQTDELSDALFAEFELQQADSDPSVVDWSVDDVEPYTEFDRDGHDPEPE